MAACRSPAHVSAETPAALAYETPGKQCDASGDFFAGVSSQPFSWHQAPCGDPSRPWHSLCHRPDGHASRSRLSFRRCGASRLFVLCRAIRSHGLAVADPLVADRKQRLHEQKSARLESLKRKINMINDMIQIMKNNYFL